MAEWLYEDGIGERRAALIDNGTIVRVLIERDSDGVTAGTVATARLISHHDRHARLDRGDDIFLTHRAQISDGSACLIAVSRAAIPERDVVKRAMGRVSDAAGPAEAPTLLAAISATGTTVRTLASHAADELESAGWSDRLDEATSGIMPFPGGILRLSLTPAMAVFDVDGTVAAPVLALAGVQTVAAAILRLGITGNIVIDLPSLPDRMLRRSIDTALDAAFLHAGEPIERTAMNGFGLIQITRRRTGPSVPERLQFGPVESAALALLRRAERAQGAGPLTIVAHPTIIVWLNAHPNHLTLLSRRSGRSCVLHPDASLGIDAGHAQ